MQKKEVCTNCGKEELFLFDGLCAWCWYTGAPTEEEKKQTD
jgi:NMD protein affecting ribosome stability and mRNA decay